VLPIVLLTGRNSPTGLGLIGDEAPLKREQDRDLSRRITEKAVLAAVRERLGDPASIRYVRERVEVEVQRLHAHLPEEIQIKRAALVAEEQRIANCISLIREGKGTRALGEALKAAEHKAQALRAVLHAYQGSKKEAFKTPPIEWIAARLMAVQAVLEAEPSKSARELRRQIGKPYYQAETALRVQGPGGRFELVALVEAVGIEPTSGNPPRQASTSIAGCLLLSPPLPPTGWLSGRPAPKSLAPHPRAGFGAVASAAGV
jgi:hypothetical protein